jgi:hypothetical protein
MSFSVELKIYFNKDSDVHTRYLYELIYVSKTLNSNIFKNRVSFRPTSILVFMLFHCLRFGRPFLVSMIELSYMTIVSEHCQFKIKGVGRNYLFVKKVVMVF